MNTAGSAHPYTHTDLYLKHACTHKHPLSHICIVYSVSKESANTTTQMFRDALHKEETSQHEGMR